MQCMNVPGAFLSLAFFSGIQPSNSYNFLSTYLRYMFFVSNCRQLTNKSSKHHCKNYKVSLCGAIFLVKKLTFCAIQK